jgi:hypothetical protein
MDDEPALYWVAARIDGCVYVLSIEAAGVEAAKREVFRALHRRERERYAVRDGGEVTVEWGNVATLRVGPAERAAASRGA